MFLYGQPGLDILSTHLKFTRDKSMVSLESSILFEFIFSI